MHLSFKESGNKDHQTLFFIHGWPDSSELWTKQMEALSSDYHCVSITLPNFDGTILNKWGYDFEQLTEILAADIREHLKTSPFKRVILVGHDWGAYLSYLLEQRHPDLIKAFVTLDVGGHMKPTSAIHSLFIIGYQWWLILAFFVGMIIPSPGNEMTRWISQLAKAPRGRNVHSAMNYLYFYFWRAVFVKKFQTSILWHYRPVKPLLYLYGAKKRFHFHSPKWIKLVESKPHNKVVAMPCYHWINMEEPGETTALIRQWLLTL